jgi:predicted dehydrogenase
VASLCIAFQSGALGLLDMSWCAPPDLARPEWALNETVVEGTRGAMKLQSDGSLMFVSLSGAARRIEVELPPREQVYVDAFVKAQSHYIDACVSGAPHETSGADTLKTMDVIWAAYRSSESQRVEAVALS